MNLKPVGGASRASFSDSRQYSHLYDILTSGVGRAHPLPEDRPLATAVAYRDAADQLILRLIHDYREAGFTWEQIGDEMGITKQAASQLHKRATRLF